MMTTTPRKRHLIENQHLRSFDYFAIIPGPPSLNSTMLVKYTTTGPQGSSAAEANTERELKNCHCMVTLHVVKTTNVVVSHTINGLLFHVVLQKTARNYSRVRGACAVRLYFTRHSTN